MIKEKALSKAIGIMRIRLLPELWVVTVRTVKSPTEILAGTWMFIYLMRILILIYFFYLTDLWSIQNETKERITMSIDGI
jgi:hypothetical protein